MLSCFPIPSSRALLHITLSILCFLGVAISHPTQNFTIEVPYGSTNHGEPNLLCTPVTWSDFAVYLLLNYVAHGATVASYPGEPAFDRLLCVVVAILFPLFGVVRAFNFIVRHPVLTAKNDLEMAARSGALCMLVRSWNWKPQKGDKIRNALIKDPGNEPSLQCPDTSHSGPSTNISPTTAALSIYYPPWLDDKTRYWSYEDTDLDEIGSRRVFFGGLSEPPDQYKFVFVPRNTEVLGLVESTPTPIPSSHFPDIPLLRSLYRIFTSPCPTPKLSSSFNLVKGMAALLQSIYALITLYRTNGGQLNRYGFAAPGLTVLPYAVSSTLNLIANLVAPHYPTLYLVRSEVMEEAERRTGLPFHYVVGKIVEESNTNDIVMEGWSEVAGSFKDDDKLLYVSPSAEDEKIEICDNSEQTIHVPICPRFRRTDGFQISPFQQFIESPQCGLRFPCYQFMARCQEALIQPSLPPHLQSNVRPLRPQRPHSLPYFRRRGLRPIRGHVHDRADPFNETVMDETLPIIIIFYAELFITFGLSKFKAQQSTLAQRAWTIAWLFAGSLGAMIAYFWKISCFSQKESRMLVCFIIVFYCAPAIGGLVVIFQMLNEYGICYKFI